MNKHKFNIFPEAKKDDYDRLREDISTNGYDKKQPITTYQNAILDGWNRMKACDELSVSPSMVEFEGSDADAVAFVMRMNKRRNLNSGQWATIAAEAEELMAAIAEEAAKNKGGRPKKVDEWPCHHCGGSHPIGDNPCHEPGEKEPQQKIVADKPSNRNVTDNKTAELFNTNRTYVNNAVKMKTEAPDVFEKVKAGTMTMQDGMKAVRAIPKDPWSSSERERQKLADKGMTVVANAGADKNLIVWAESCGKAVRVDRGSKFGNPFVIPYDGDRDYVCDCYVNHYLPYKPSILNSIDDLIGKVLICHCFPERCHADALADKANMWT